MKNRQSPIMPLFYRLILLSIMSTSLIYCSEGKLTTPSKLSAPATNIINVIVPTTTIMSYGACEKTEDTRFSIENCDSPSTCHVKDLGDGICRPSCGYLSVISENGKYYGYGADKEPYTEDDPHTLTGSVPCTDLEKWGVTDWEKIPLIDDIEPWEVIENKEQGYTSSECCGSDQQVEKNNQNL